MPRCSMPMTKGEAPTPEGRGQNHISYTRSRMSSPVLTSAIRNTVNQVRVVGRDEVLESGREAVGKVVNGHTVAFIQ